MNISLKILIVLASSMVAIAWIPSKRFSGVQLNLKQRDIQTSLNVAQPTDKADATGTSTTIPEFLLSSGPDRSSIGTILIAQSVLVGVVFVASFFTYLSFGLDFIKFDSDSMRTAAFFAVPMIAGGFVFDNLPWKVAKEIKRDTQSFTLRLFGIDSSIISTLLWAFLLAGAAGFSEELFFRGLVFESIENASNPVIALIASSAIFGLAHFPLWGANAFVEAILGGVFGYAYWYSGYNLAVPIAIHTMYDFFTLVVTWYFAKNDINQKLFQSIKNEVVRLKSLSSREIDELSTRVFNILDLNKDGSITPVEFDEGIRLYGYGVMPLANKMSTFDLFRQADLNNDGKIELSEFKEVVRKDMRKLGDRNF